MKKIYFFLMAMVISVTHAQDGKLDLSYVPNQPLDYLHAGALDSSGNLFLGGSNYNAGIMVDVIKLTPTGTVDPTFNVTYFDSYTNSQGNYAGIFAICIQSDGKILVGGRLDEAPPYNTTILRFNANGTLDTTFTDFLPQGFTVNDIVIQPGTNKIIVGGHTETSYVTQGIFRLNSNGSIDTTFNSGGTGTLGWVHDILMLPNGDFYIGGDFDTYNGASRKNLAKINANGSLNAIAFEAPTIGFVTEMDIDSQSRVVAVGSFIYLNQNLANRIFRYTTSGAIDTSFNPPSVPSPIYPYDFVGVHVQPSDKIVVSGTFNNVDSVSRKGIARLNTDGSLDTCFDPGTGADQGGLLHLVVGPNEQIYGFHSLTSYDGTPRAALAKIIGQTTITAVADFGTVTDAGGVAIANVLSNDNLNGSVPTINDVVLTQVSTTNSNVNLNTSNGQIYIAPGTPPGSYTVNYKICQANCYCSTVAANITVTTPPIVPGLRADSRVTESGLQSNSKIIITGSFYNYNNIPVNRIARLKTDLTLDTSFLSTGAVPSTSPEASDIEIQADDKIIVTGNFVGYNGVNTGDNIVRLNPNGTIDAGFNPSGTGAAGSTNSGSIESVAIQSDGKIVIGGNFTSFNGIPLNYIARLNTNGTPDNSFVVGSGFDRPVTEVAIQTRSIIVTGQFVTYKGVPVRNIERLDSSGNLDTSFNPGGSGIGYLISGGIIYGQVEGIYPQTDGKIYLVGQFISYNGASRNNIVRLNANGTLDTSFNPGTGFNSTTRTLVVEPSGKIIVGGDFSTFNGVPVNSLVRLNTNGTLDNSFNTGTGPSGRVHTLKRQVDSKVIVGGEFINYNGIYAGNITRINPAIPGNQSRGPGVWESEPAIDITASVNNDITIYPNPSTGIFNLNFKGDANEKFEIVIYNTLGQLIHQGTVSPETAKQIDLSRFEAGNYYIRLQNEQRTINKVVTKK